MKIKLFLNIFFVIALFSTHITSPSMSIFPRLSKTELMRGVILPATGALSLCGAIEWYKSKYMTPIAPEANPATPAIHDEHSSSLQLINNNKKTTLGLIVVIAALAYAAYNQQPEVLD